MITPQVYANWQEYNAVFSGTDQTQAAGVDDALAVCSAYVNGVCHRFFGKDDAPVSRNFRVGQTNRYALYLQDFASAPTAVLVDGAAVTFAYEPVPLNAPLEPEPRPYRGLAVAAGASAASYWIGGRLVTVTAQWGWPAVPGNIKRATIELAGILRSQSPRATMRYDEAGAILGASRASREIVDGMLRPYILRSMGG